MMSTPLSVLAVLATGCATSLSTMQPADTLPRGHWHAGAGQNVIVPVSRVTDAIDAATDLERQCRDNGCMLDDAQKRRYLDAAIGLALNAPGTTSDFMLRYGVWDRVDAGVRWSTTGVHADVKVQFLELDGWAASISLGYRRQLFSGKIFEVLGELQIDDFSRNDVEVPVILGRRLGDKGYLWGGPKYVFARYSLDATLKLESVPDIQSSDDNIHYLGGFAGLAVGYKKVYVFAELTAMHMFARPEILGEHRELGGLIIVPSVGIMLRL